jgi:hypothetical protein
MLNEAFRRSRHLARIQDAIDEAIKDLKKQKVSVPRDLEKRLKAKLKGTALAWDQALWELTRRKDT